MFAASEIINPFWGKILTPKGVEFMIKYGKQELSAIYYLQGIYWNKTLNHQLKAGDKLTIPKEKHSNIGGCAYKVMDSGLIKMDAEEQESYKAIEEYIVSKKYTSGVLFKYKGLLLISLS